jgi:hypothetical protein
VMYSLVVPDHLSGAATLEIAGRHLDREVDLTEFIVRAERRPCAVASAIARRASVT